MNLETLSRPYAQAIFDHSEGWVNDLSQLEAAMKEPNVRLLIESPTMAYKEKAEIFIIFQCYYQLYPIFIYFIF